MSKVKLLPKETAELIAAGEVIERPASVAKELIENAIDSGAKKITIEIRGGGVAFLRVTDDGSGIAFEDVPIAFLRHATSKISKGTDLDAIYTLGFRGEALASVCAVSKTELFTKEKGVDFGTHYVINAGEEETLERVGCPDGTSIIIRDLFYNVPARLKFLRKDISESNAVAAVVHRIALSHPEIAFSFIRDNKRELQTSGDGDLFADIHAVLGRQFAASLIPVEFDFRGIKISGFTSRPLFARANRSFEYFFVNGRAIRSFVCMNAAEEAYKNSVMGGRFPACVIHITLPPSIMDVNAHPAKLEVKFSDEKLIYDSVFFAVKNALINDAAPIEIQPVNAESATTGNITDDNDHNASAPTNYYNNLSFNSVKADNLTHNIGNTNFRYLSDNAFRKTPERTTGTALVADLPGNNSNFDVRGEGVLGNNLHSESFLDISHHAENFRNGSLASDNILDGDFTSINVPIMNNAGDYTLDRNSATDNTADDVFASAAELKLIGEAFATYIICEYETDLYIIDKHAAHERILYENLKSSVKSGELSCQYIFGEKPIAVSAADAAIAEEFCEGLRGLGFEYTVSDNVIVFTGIPSVLSDTDGFDIETTFCEILQNLTLHKNDPLPKLIDETLHSIACKAAIKGSRVSGEKELLSLAERVLGDSSIRYCPHGRPVIFKISQRELEKNFKRIQ